MTIIVVASMYRLAASSCTMLDRLDTLGTTKYRYIEWPRIIVLLLLLLLLLL